MSVTPSNVSTLSSEDAQIVAARAEELFRQLDRIEHKLDETLALLKSHGPPTGAFRRER